MKSIWYNVYVMAEKKDYVFTELNAARTFANGKARATNERCELTMVVREGHFASAHFVELFRP